MSDAQIYVLGLLAEEMGETLQLIGKALRFGLDARRRDGECARSLLPKEIGDILAAIHFAERAGIIDLSECLAHADGKLAKLLDPFAIDDEGRRLAPDLTSRRS